MTKIKEVYEKIRVWVLANKQAVIIGGVVVVICAIIALCIALFGHKDVPPPVETPATSEVAVPEAPKQPMRRRVAKPATQQTKLSYTDAVKKYSGQRIQLDQKCAASPFESTYKNNTPIMLDNRSSAVRTVQAFGATYTIAPYDYIVVTATAATLPHTALIDCGSSQNVATVLVQR